MKTIQNLAIVGLMGASLGVQAAQYKGVDVAPGELIVKLKDGHLKSFLASKATKNIAVKENLNVAFGDVLLIKTFNKSMDSAMAELNALPEVEYAEPNYLVSIGSFEEASPRDAEYGKLWGLKNTGANEPDRSGNTSGKRGVKGADIAAEAAWGLTRGSNDVKIAVIDTGVDYRHEDLKNQMWVNEAELNGEEGKDDDGNGYVDDVYGYDFANNDGDPIDGHSHGTHCAGTIAGEHNNVGVAGVMANAKIVAVKFLSDSGSGSTANAIKAVDYATKVNVDIMSNSWGGGGHSQALKDAITRAKDAGILFVAAAGNSATNNDSRPHYPSNYDVENVISVAAHNAQDTLASFSCYGKRTVHVAAPGRNILSTVKNGGYAVYSGTSMATPHVSGILGLLVAKEGRSDVSEIRQRLMKSSVYVSSYKGKSISEGRANAFNLLTNTFPARPAKPDPNAWTTRRLRSVIESEHPYPANGNQKFEVTQEGAKFLRIVFEKVELENKYDTLTIKDQNGAVVDTISGSVENYASEYVEGSKLSIEFKSDRSVQKWGFKASELQFIAE